MHIVTKKQSFTLIELLIVIAIVGILASIMISSMTSATNSANDAKRKADINQLVRVLLTYNAANASYPISSTTCNIGSDCSAGVNAALGNGVNARDPSGGYYTYFSADGTAFTISTVMSDSRGYAYNSAISGYNSSRLLGWSKRKPITIASTSALTNYQAKLTISYDTDMQADFDDLRFTSSDGTTQLNYWLESKTNSSTATVWVKVPALASGNTSIYMYYGNASAVSASSGDNTFEFFDGFDSATLNTSKWSVTGPGAISISNSVLRITTATPDWTILQTNSTFSAPISQRFSAKLSAEDISYQFGLRNDHGAYVDAYRYQGVTRWVTYNGGATNTARSDSFVGSFQTFDIALKSGQAKFYYNNLLRATHTASIPSTAQKAYFAIGGEVAGITLDLDYVFIYKYADSIPTSSFGAEEVS